ncbi:MAG: hypothetical protein IBX39_09985, partial [Candidatus Methanoperedenaceae archaeon]|nr:hypothetical protein [Candidatus Methanoperedenaceae archaeon]
MNRGQDEDSFEKPVSRRRFIIILGFFFAAIIGIVNMLKKAYGKIIGTELIRTQN